MSNGEEDPFYGGYLEYTREKLGSTVDALEGEGRIQERLFRGWLAGLHVVQPRYLPDDLRIEIELIRFAFGLVSAEKPEEGRVAAALRELSEEEARDLVARIERLYEEVKARTGWRPYG